MAHTEFTLYGDVAVTVRVTDIGDGSFRFDVAVVTEGEDYTGQIGELNGIWFNLPDEGGEFDYGALSITGAVDYQIAQDDVNKLDGGVTLSGAVLKENGGEFDAGVLIDETGLKGSEGTLETSFVLTDISGTLTLDHFTSGFAEQYFGVRLTSVGEPDGARDGSLKLGSAPGDEIVEDAPEEPVVDTPEEPVVETPEEPLPVHAANDDTLYAMEDEVFGAIEPLNEGPSVLSNDTTDGGAYTGLVTDATVGTPIAGSNGGLLIVNPDGTVDFSANDEFDFLTGTETATTEFSYGIEGGATATVTVTVLGLDDGAGDGDLGAPIDEGGLGGDPNDLGGDPILGDDFFG